MGLLKYAVIGAAVAYGVQYLTKKDENGRSIIDDLKDRAPEYTDKLKAAGEKYVNEITQKVKDKAAEYQQQPGV
ncbi:YtxH domain-containing protein [Mucilaginibacter sp.]